MMTRVLITSVLSFCFIGNVAFAQEDNLFEKGKKAPNVHHTGDVWLKYLNRADETFDFNVAMAIFAPGAKLNWHMHPAGQQLYVLEGIGYYQERGKELQILKKGYHIKCSPGVEHWHAASPDEGVTYMAVSGNKPTVWLDELTEEYYLSLKKD